MIILGITDSFTSGAAISIDGRIIAAVNEERLDRNKMSMGFPNLSITEVMKIAGVKASDIDQVAVATSNLFWRPESVPYTDYFRDKKGGFRDTFLSLGSAFSKVFGNLQGARQIYYGLKTQLTRPRRQQLPDRLRDKYGITAPVRFIDHHLCHATSAYFTSGYREATVITQDGAGDGKCSRVYAVKDGKFRQLQKLDSYDSVGNYYSYVTHLCGFKAHKHEGKITGLAAYGKPAYLDILKRFVSYDGNQVSNIGRCFDHSAIEKLRAVLPEDFSHEDLSASVQKLLEESVSAFCDHWVRKSGIGNVALAGGVFANVKLNQRIHELDSVNNIFVHPGMGDDGLAVGAALFLDYQADGYKPLDVIDHVYFGDDLSEEKIDAAIEKSGLELAECPDGVERAVAELLANGNVIARCAGRMEYGPRALGNRTIMYQTTDPAVNKWLNDKLSRTEFMPFAPVTLWEERHRCYKNIEGAEQTARFMTITFDCTEEMKKMSPAVCHVDGTARPQLIREEDNPEYYRILSEYHRITGIPSLVNTSFNIHEEPIVNTPEEALQAFSDSELDALLLGNRLLLSDHLKRSRGVDSQVSSGQVKARKPERWKSRQPAGQADTRL
jgi:carbamoyltransferase